MSGMSARSSGQSGKITWVTALAIAAVAGGIYWIVAYGQAYIDNFEVKSIVNSAGNMAYREDNDEKVKNFIRSELTQLFEEEPDDFGGKQLKHGIVIGPEDLFVERSKIPPEIRIELTYSRVIDLPLVKKQKK